MAKKKNAKEARENKKKELLVKHAESRRQQMEMNQQKQQAAQRPAPSESNAADDGMPTLEEQLKRVPKNEQSFPPVRLPEHPLAESKEICFDEFTLEVAALSPLHLGSGRADVNVDAEVVHDRAGLPYFPGKRLKGLIYESALEVLEMSELAGLNLFTEEEMEELFQHNVQSDTQLTIPNLHLASEEAARQMEEDWLYLQQHYPELVSAQDVLSLYTSLRYQTMIDRETGTAAETSLRNIRVVDEGLTFCGTVRLKGGTRKKLTILALALHNLSQAGMKRNRGFGRISCAMLQHGKDIRSVLVNEALKGGKV